MSEKRPIDRHRDSAISAKVGTDDEGAIKEMISLGEAMFVVKEHAIYSMKLADQIDPDRTNISIPQSIHQKWASVGTESELVSRTLLTAVALFKTSYLQPSVDCNRCIIASMEILKELLALNDATERFQRLQKEQTENLPVGSKNFHLPSVPEAKTYTESFISHAEHAVQKIFDLCEIFYGDEIKNKKKFLDGLLSTITEKYGANDGFAEFLTAATRFLKFIRNTRHCVEHEQATQRIDIKDFALSAAGKINLPTIEVIHPDTPQNSIPISDFMKQVLESLLDVTENLIAFLCSKQTRSAGMLVEICQVPEGRRHHKGVRFGYMGFLGGQWILAG